MDMLTAEVGIHLGVSNLVLWELLKWAIHGVVSTQWSENAVLNECVERLLRYVFHRICQQAEVQAAVEILLFAQSRGVDACHD